MLMTMTFRREVEPGGGKEVQETEAMNGDGRHLMLLAIVAQVRHLQPLTRDQI